MFPQKVLYLMCRYSSNRLGLYPFGEIIDGYDEKFLLVLLLTGMVPKYPVPID